MLKFLVKMPTEYRDSLFKYLIYLILIDIVVTFLWVHTFDVYYIENSFYLLDIPAISILKFSRSMGK